MRFDDLLPFYHHIITTTIIIIVMAVVGNDDSNDDDDHSKQPFTHNQPIPPSRNKNSNNAKRKNSSLNSSSVTTTATKKAKRTAKLKPWRSPTCPKPQPSGGIIVFNDRDDKMIKTSPRPELISCLPAPHCPTTGTHQFSIILIN